MSTKHIRGSVPLFQGVGFPSPYVEMTNVDGEWPTYHAALLQDGELLDLLEIQGKNVAAPKVHGPSGNWYDASYYEGCQYLEKAP